MREELSVYKGKLTEGLEEKEQMQHHFETLLTMAVEWNKNTVNEAKEKYRIMEEERNSLRGQLSAINKKYKAALEKNVEMRKYYERTVYIATLTIDRIKKEIKGKCSKPVDNGEGKQPIKEGERKVETWHEKLLRELKKEYGVDPPEKMTEEKEEEAEEHLHDKDNDVREFENVEDEDEGSLKEKETYQTLHETNVPATTTAQDDVEKEQQEAYSKLSEDLSHTMRHAQKVTSNIDEILSEKKRILEEIEGNPTMSVKEEATEETQKSYRLLSANNGNNE